MNIEEIYQKYIQWKMMPFILHLTWIVLAIICVIMFLIPTKSSGRTTNIILLTLMVAIATCYHEYVNRQNKQDDIIKSIRPS